MRILFLALDIDLERQRGDTIHAIELAQALQAIGHAVTVVVGRNGSSGKTLARNLPVHEIRGPDWRILRTIRRLAQVEHADVIYERRFSPKIGYALRTFLGIPLVLEVNGILREELFHQDTGRRPRSSTKGRIRNAMLRRVDRFVAVSDAIRDDLVQTCGVEAAKVRVIGNGVNVERFRSIEKEEACRAIGLSAETPRASFVGNLVGWRDFRTVLDGVAEARLTENVEVQIIGTGPDQNRVAEMVRSLGLERAVHLNGEVPHGRVPLHLASADVCLLPEKPRAVDISPLKLFEYLACARPVIASRVRGLEIVESLGVGLLYEAGDAKELSHHLVDLLRNPMLRREMGVRGRSYVERERSWKSVAFCVTEVLEDAVTNAS